MSNRKFIYWDEAAPDCDGKVFANVHYLVGYNQGTIQDYQDMAKVLRKTFPEAKDDQLHCCHVIRSSSMDGFTLLTYNAKIDVKGYNGWSEVNGRCMEYSFA